MGTAYSTHEGDSDMILVGKPEGKSLLGRPRHRWKDDY
jgi:hypothetical protein